jgi:hypothetical protein
MRFAAVHESLVGTFETCRPHRSMSVAGGKAEDIYSQRAFRLLTHFGHQARLLARRGRRRGWGRGTVLGMLLDLGPW